MTHQFHDGAKTPAEILDLRGEYESGQDFDTTSERGRELIREFLREAGPGTWYVTPRRLLNEIEAVGHDERPADVDCRDVARAFGHIYRDELDEETLDADDPLRDIDPEK